VHSLVDDYLSSIVTAEMRESCCSRGSNGASSALMAIATSSDDPLAPLVVGVEGSDYEQEGEDANKNLHRSIRIAWTDCAEMDHRN